MNDWWTAPAESDDGRLVMVTGRSDVEKFRSNPRYSIRIEVSWTYDESPDAGMPGDKDAEMMEIATDRFHDILSKDKAAVMTGIYTGAGCRTWVFYATSTHIFQKKLNEAFEPLPLLPLRITAENDPGWEEYDEMRTLEIN